MPHPFEKLARIVETLRGPNGCPWDKEQTFKDINPYLLEEAHEVVEAIDRKDFSELKEELGDLLVHIFFFAQLAREENRFDAEAIAQGACEKLIRRHPHVFGELKLNGTEEVLQQWEKIKAEEKARKGKQEESLLKGFPPGLPALIQAFRVGEKTSRVGFDWSTLAGILGKVKEEIGELEKALASGEAAAVESEYGDLLFTLANVGRFLKLDPETSLRQAIRKFTLRFQRLEEKAKTLKIPLQDLPPEEWNRLWEEVKSGTPTP